MTNVLNSLKNTAKKLKTNTAGNFGIIASLSLFVLVGGAAMAVDASNGFAAKQRLQTTTDAIALMAAKDLSLSETEIVQLANDYHEVTYPGATGDRLTINSVERSGDTVTLDASNNINAYFARVFGHETLDIRTNSVASLARRDLDIALVLDNTGSMRGSKLAALKAASNDLVDILYQDPNLSRGTQLGLVPFASWVNVGADQIELASLDLRGVSDQNDLYFTNNQGRLDRYDDLGVDWDGCVENRLPPYDVDDTAPNPARPETLFQPAFNPKSANPAARADTSCDERRKVTPLTNNIGTIRRAISSMQASGWTNIANGATWGFRLDSPNAPFTQARPYEDENVKKAMVILTDGKQTMRPEASNISNYAYSPFGFYGERALNRNTQRLEGRTVKEALDNKLSETCEAAKAKDITVYTITFELDDRETQDIMRDCATTAGNYFDVASARELSPVFEQIASSLSNLRLTN